MMVYYSNPYIIIGNPSLTKAYGGITPSTPPQEQNDWSQSWWDDKQESRSCRVFFAAKLPGILSSLFERIGLKTSPNMTQLGGGFRYFFFHPLFGEDEPILTHIFQMGWFNHQLAGM